MMALICRHIPTTYKFGQHGENKLDVQLVSWSPPKVSFHGSCEVFQTV